MDQLERTAFAVILFDEALNSSVKKGQMDLHIRFNNDNNCQVSTRYLNSELLQKASLVDAYETFDACCSALGKKKSFR